MYKKIMMDKKNWAVVGVTEKKDRYGYKIWRILEKFNYKVYGVNPNYNEIEGEKIYHKLGDIGEKIDVVDMVVPARVSINILDEIKDLGIEYIWFQPGSFNDEVIKKANDLGLKILYDDCIYAILKKIDH